MNRRRDLDQLRGFLLVMMTVTHLPTRFSGWVTQPLGFVSAAEGFVFLSAFLAGIVYTRRAAQSGLPAMRRAFFQRALKLYACHAAMLLFLFAVIAKVGVALEQAAILNLLSFYFREPATAVWSGLALIYSPPLVDILPLYVVFMLVSPGILSYGLRRGWTVIMTVSIGAWLLAQFDFGKFAYHATVGLTGVPYRETGAFEMSAWQLLWVTGLWMGSNHAVAPNSCREFPRWLIAAAAVIVVTGVIWRHAVGLLPFGPDADLNWTFDKWHIAPLRLLNFSALLMLTLRFGPTLRLKLRCAFLEKLGAASLQVFCAHLVIVLLALALTGDQMNEAPWWAGMLLIGGSLAALYVVAWISQDPRASSAGMPQAQPDIINAHAVR